jgi:hypothetical protein
MTRILVTAVQTRSGWWQVWSQEVAFGAHEGWNEIKGPDAEVS